MSTDQVSFYDESLKKHLEGNFVSDGKEIHVYSEYGAKSASYGDLGACIDHNAQVLLVQKLLSELARDAATGSGLQLEGSSDGVSWTVFYSTNVQGVVGEIITSISSNLTAGNFQQHRVAIAGNGAGPIYVAQAKFNVLDTGQKTRTARTLGRRYISHAKRHAVFVILSHSGGLLLINLFAH
jgi:hypothetical protein